MRVPARRYRLADAGRTKTQADEMCIRDRSEADLIILPGSGRGRDHHPRLDETIVAVLRRWPGTVWVAG